MASAPVSISLGFMSCSLGAREVTIEVSARLADRVRTLDASQKTRVITEIQHLILCHKNSLTGEDQEAIDEAHVTDIDAQAVHGNGRARHVDHRHSEADGAESRWRAIEAIILGGPALAAPPPSLMRMTAATRRAPHSPTPVRFTPPPSALTPAPLRSSPPPHVLSRSPSHSPAPSPASIGRAFHHASESPSPHPFAPVPAAQRRSFPLSTPSAHSPAVSPAPSMSLRPPFPVISQAATPLLAQPLCLHMDDDDSDVSESRPPQHHPRMSPVAAAEQFRASSRDDDDDHMSTDGSMTPVLEDDDERFSQDPVADHAPPTLSALTPLRNARDHLVRRVEHPQPVDAGTLYLRTGTGSPVQTSVRVPAATPVENL